MIEIGDAIKFAELAWIVLDYGWSPDLNATRQYHEFFRDVESLAQSLEHLTSVIEAARQSFSSRRLNPPPPTFGWDHQSLVEIVGDFNATLRECERLIATNESYAVASGPVKNVRWNAMVVPSVERLRRRIVMHQAKLQHLLRPFEIDLHIRLHADLAQRIDSMHEDVRHTQSDVRTIRRQMEALQRFFDPDAILETEIGPQDPTSNTLVMPNTVRETLEHMLSQRFDGYVDEDGTSALSDLADAFIRHLDVALHRISDEGVLIEENDNAVKQYICLLTCQFLMSKMKASEDILQAPEDSHWPRYVESLHQQLQNACIAFNQVNGFDFVPHDISSLQIPGIWQQETPAPYIESTRVPAAIDQILELDIINDTPRRWRRINVFRYCDGADRRFRLDISAGDIGQSATETRKVDFDLESTSLVPRYASPTGEEPLELTLKTRDEIFRLEFFSRSDLYLFQQALTGYEVADDYMSYRVKTIFSTNSKIRKINEYSALQLWLPCRLEGVRAVDADSSGEEYIGKIDEPFNLPSRTSTTTSRDGGMSLNPNHTIPRRPVASQASPAIPARRGSAPLNNFGNWQTRRSWSTRGSSTSGWAPASPTSANFNTYASPRRVSTGRGVASRPQASGQESRQTSRTGSLSSNSTSSTETMRRLSGGRQGSFSAPSVNTMATSMSTATARSVSISGQGNIASVGTLHCKPSEPLLVFFTRDLETGTHGIVALSLEQGISANFEACKCKTRPDCHVTAIEASGGQGRGSDILPVTRLGGVAGATVWWNILSLAESMKSRRSSMESSGAIEGGSRAWQKVIRISMQFETLDERRRFAGQPCTCEKKLEGQLMKCLAEGHRGHLGVVLETYRKQMLDWHERRYRQQVNMVDKPQRLGPENEW